MAVMVWASTDQMYEPDKPIYKGSCFQNFVIVTLKWTKMGRGEVGGGFQGDTSTCSHLHVHVSQAHGTLEFAKICCRKLLFTVGASSLTWWCISLKATWSILPSLLSLQMWSSNSSLTSTPGGSPSPAHGLHSTLSFPYILFYKILPSLERLQVEGHRSRRGRTQKCGPDALLIPPFPSQACVPFCALARLTGLWWVENGDDWFSWQLDTSWKHTGRVLARGSLYQVGLWGLSWLLIDVVLTTSLKVVNTIPILSTDSTEVEKANWALGIHILVSALDCGHGVAPSLPQVLAALTSLQWWTITWNCGQKQTFSLPPVAFLFQKYLFINHHRLNVRITEVVFLQWRTVLGTT